MRPFGEREVVCHHDQRRLRVPVQFFQHLDDRPARFLVEVSGGLVGKQDLRAIGEGSSQGYSLLLSTGELSRKVVEPVT